MFHFFVTKAVTKPHKPKTKVKNAHRAKRVDALARRMQRAVSLDLLTGLTRFKKRISAERLQEAWESGNYEGLDRLIPWDKLDDDLQPTARRLRRSLFDSSGIAFAQLPAPIQSSLRWDVENPRIRNFIDHRVGMLIQGIKNDTRAQVRELVSQSFTRALTPREVASEIKDSIGLHEQYRKALSKYKRFVIYESGEKNPENQMKRINAYEDRLLKSRAMTVARTETRQATNHGQRTVWREAANQGLINRTTARRVWVVDGNPCEICEPLDGVETTLDQPFPGGYEPGEVHPNCECIEILEME